MIKQAKTSRKENVLKNSSASIFLRLLSMGMKFVIRTVFIYFLGVEYTGISTLFTDILQVLALFDLGISSAMIYALYKPMAESDERKVSALINYYKKAYNTIGILIILAGLVMTPFINYLVKGVPNIKEDIHIIFMLYVITTASSYFLVYKSSLIIADQRARIIFLIDSAIVFIENIIVIVLIVIFRDFIIYLITHLLFVIFRNLVINYIANKKYSHLLKYKDEVLTKYEKKDMFHNVVALGIYKVAGVVIYSTDSIVISAFIGTAHTAIIGNFNLIINSIRQIIESVAETTKASVGNLAISSTKEKQKEVFDKINFLCYWVAVFCSTCLFVLLNPFIGEIWFSEKFMLDMEIIIVLVINFYIAVMVYPVEVFRTGNGLFIQGKYRPMIMAIMNIILDIVFVRFWGIFGVLLATLISRASTQLWYDAYLVYSNIFKKSVKDYLIDYAKKVLLAIGIAFIAYALANIPNIANKYISFIYKLFIAVTISNATLIILFRKDKNFKTLISFIKKY